MPSGLPPSYEGRRVSHRGMVGWDGNARVGVRSLEAGETCLDSGGDGDGRGCVHGHAFYEDAGDEGGDFVRERVDERGDAENRRVWSGNVSDIRVEEARTRRTSLNESGLVSCDFLACSIPALGDLGRAQD